MFKYVLRRLLVLIPVLFLVTVLISSLIYFSPGDPVRVMLGLRANEEAVKDIRAELGLDKPYYLRYLNWLGNAVQGNFGRSWQRNEKVLDLNSRGLPATLEMMAFAIVVTLLISVPIGVVSAIRVNTSIDDLFSFFSLFWVSMPGFWMAIVAMLLFSMHWSISHLRPRRTDLDSERTALFALPGLILGIRQVALISRLIRASMLDVLNEDFIRTARSKGLAERVVIYKHAFRNAMIPTVTIFGVQIPELISLGVIIETVFAWPGTGRMLVDAVIKRDYTLVQGIVLVYSLLVIMISLLVDILYGYIDPRIKRE